MLLIGGIILYRSYALYEEEQEFNVLKGTIPPFHQGDIQLSFTVDGVSGSNFPTKEEGLIAKNVTCEKEGVTAEWDNDLWGLVNVNANGNKKVNCSIDFVSHNFNLADNIIKLSETRSDIERVSHEATEQTLALIDYRYVGANPDNYVCFGYEGERCPDNNLYRIIGVIPTQSSENSVYENRVKLIKATSYGDYIWTGNEENKRNDWTKSTFNTNTLNGTYWSSLGDYQKYISPAKWYLGGSYHVKTAEELYVQERENVTNPIGNAISTVANIGLMYASDYGYATGGGKEITRETCLATTLDKYYQNCASQDWIFLSGGEWTITSVGYYYADAVINLVSDRPGSINIVGPQIEQIVRPVFYLKKEVAYKSGNGSIDNPYVLGL